MRGTILVITLWIITLLSAIALSITYRMRVELKLAGYELNRDKAFCIAKAGVIQAIGVLNQNTNEYDALSEAWSNYSAELYGVNLFKDISVGEGKFNVSYVYEKDVFTGTQQVFYGMQDEERKINVNKSTQDVLESLLGITPDIAMSLRAWRGDPEVAPDIIFKEDAYYQGLPKPYKRKGKPIVCLEELTLVRGITPELLYGKDMDGDGVISVNEQGLVKYINVYGDDGLVNVNTADVTVLRALGFTEDLSYRIIRYRLGYDELLGTSDDGIFTDVSKIAENLNYFEPLAPGEEDLINQKQALLKVKSRYYTAYVEGSISNASRCRITAVLDKESAEGSQIVRWIEE